MKKILLVAIVSVIFSATLFAQNVEEIKLKIEQMNKIYSQAMIENNLEKMMTLYTDDVISLPSYQPMIRGIEKIRELSDIQFNSGWKTNQFDLNTTDVFVSGNLAIEIGNYDMKMSGPDVPEWSDYGKYITIWEIQKDGSLKIKIETWNPDSYPFDQGEEVNEEDQE